MIDRQGRPTHKIAFMYWDHDRTQSTRAYKFCFQTHIYMNKNQMRVKLMGVISMLPLPSLSTITNIFRVTHTQRRCWYCVACILVCLVLQTFGSRKCVTAAVTTIISEKTDQFCLLFCQHKSSWKCRTNISFLHSHTNRTDKLRSLCLWVFEFCIDLNCIYISLVWANNSN